MGGFKKDIFRSEDGASIEPVGPFISVYTPPSGNGCYREVTILVETDESIKINITGSFETGGSWATSTELTGPNQKYTTVTDEVIATNTYYNFGIVAANSGSTPNVSSITFAVNDFTTGVVIQSYFLTVNHAATPC